MNHGYNLMGQIWSYMKIKKKWWLGPVFVVFALLSTLIVLTEGSAVAPFVYTLF